MKLVRFGDRRTGLVVDLEAGPHIIDVVASVGALLPHDPISNGVLFKWRTEWHFERRRTPLIEHWSHASAGLRRLINLALMAPDHPHLVLRTYDDAQVMLHDSCGIVALEISETREIQFWDPTGRAVMRAQLADCWAKTALGVSETISWLISKSLSRSPSSLL